MASGWRTLGTLVVCAVASLATGCASETGDAEDGAEATDDALTIDPAYAAGKRHSDLTPAVVANLTEILARGSGDVHRLMKIGDSITYSSSFLDCLNDRALTGDMAKYEPTRAHFDNGSWERRSKSTTIGWHTWQPLGGMTGVPGPDVPAAVELREMNAKFAVVMLGTNDDYLPTYKKQLGRLVDWLTARGVVPVLSTIPPSLHASADARIPGMNEVVRGIASTRKVPLMDFHLALEDLPRHGISSDGTHPNAAPGGACDFSRAGLAYGYNARNKLAIEAIDRVKRVLLDGETP